MSRTVSARIPTVLHEELRERCNMIGESINDYIKAAIEMVLHNECEFNFGDEFEEKTKSEQIQTENRKSNGDMLQFKNHLQK